MLYPIIRICNVLNVKVRSYYKWVATGKKVINNFDKITAEIILVEHLQMKKVYGTFRLKEQIKIDYGIIMNHKKIRRYKTALNIHTIVRKKRGLSLRGKEKELQNKAPYILRCNFKSECQLSKLSSDVSYIKCSEGMLYLSVVKDLFNNQIISYSISEKNDTELIMQSFKNIPKGNGIINTDQGSVYFSNEYVSIIKKLGYTRSMSHRGSCWENSPVENWFSQLKEEWLRPLGIKSQVETEEEIKKYIEWYNTQRIQKSLGYLSPIKFLQTI